MALASGDPNMVARANAPSLNAIARNYAAASRTLENLPAGGAKDRAVRDLVYNQARDRTAVMSGGTQEALARLASMGWGGTQAGVGAFGTATSGLGQAGQTYANLAGSKGQSAGSAAAGIGSIAGLFL